MRTRHVFTLLLVPPLAVLACSRSQRPEGESQQAASNRPLAPRTTTQTLLLQSLNDSHIAGVLTLAQEADTLTVKLNLEHLTPGDEYQAYVYYGKCHAQGPKAVALESVLADAGGTGSSSTRVPQARLGQTPTEERHEGFFIQVLQPNGTRAACVDLPSEEPATT